MEMLDELNDRGEPTGRVTSRGDAHKTGVYHRAVVLFLINGRKQVLLQKRSLKKKNWPGLWDVTSGGHVDAGEDAVSAAIRELKEELGVTISAKDVEFIGKSQTADGEGGMINRHFNEYYIAAKDIDAAGLKLQKDEVDAARWFDYAKIKQMIERKDRTLTDKWDAFGALLDFIDKA